VTDPYGKLLERLWQDAEMQALRDRDFRIFCYLLSNRHRTIVGVYYLPVPLAAHELRIRQDDVELALHHRLTSWVSYDPRTEEVWVRSLAAVNLDQPHDYALPMPKNPQKPDKRVPALRKGVEAIRSLYLKREWLAYYGEWNLQLCIPLPGPTEAPLLALVHHPKGDGSPSDGASKPDSSNRYQVTVAGSSSVDSANQPAGPVGSFKAGAGKLMPLVRDHLYIGGKPPADYNDGRDFDILCTLLAEGYTSVELQNAIEGMALMRDAGELEGIATRGEALTMRALYNTQHGVRHTIDLAQDYLHKWCERRVVSGKGLESLGQVMGRMAR
jgi:hypothetical protein